MATHLRRAFGIVVVGLFLVPSAWAGSVGSWSPLPSMSTPRYAAAAATLSDGRVLVAGGQDGSGNATASAEIYNPTTNAWSAAAPMGSARVYAAAAPLPGDRVLVAGGDVGGAPSASAEIYDGTTNTWSPGAPMAYARAGAVAEALPDGTVWVAGGLDSEATEIYDPVADAWALSMTIDESRVGSASASLGSGEVLLAGGYDPGIDEPTLFDAVETTSTGAASLSSAWTGPLYEAAAAPLGDGQALLVGGSPTETDPSGVSGAEIFDQHAWSTVAPMTTARYGAVAVALADGQVLVAGGEGGSGPLASAEVFAPPTLVNLSPPEIQDASQPYRSTAVDVGDQLDYSLGGWDPAGGEGWTFSAQWQRCFSTCQDVGSDSEYTGAYNVSEADEGATIRLVATVTWNGDSVSVVSPAAGPVPEPGFHLVPGALQSMSSELASGHAAWFELPVERNSVSGVGEVSYRVWDPTGAGYPALVPVTGVLVFAPGQPTATIDFRMTVQGVPLLPASIEVQLYGGYPLSVISPSQDTVSIRDPGSPLYARDPANPLALHATPPAGNPLAGAHFFADYLQSLPGRVAAAWAGAPALAAKVAVIAREPNVQRFGAWNGLDPGWDVASYLNRAAAEEPGTVPMISTYRVVSGHCGHWSDPPLAQSAYHTWITSLAEGISTHPAILFLEMDSLITAGCLSPAGVTVRMHELRDAINVLSNDPHLVVYLDAGAADALPARYAASLLRRAGVAAIQGFFLNSTHFDWTSREIRYGEQISRLVGGKHFVVNTAENGQGPLRPRHPATQGNEVLCDPAGRGLGPLPTASTGYPKVDAFAWIANPGVSGGQCRAGAPPSGVFWPSLALELVRHEDFAVR